MISVIYHHIESRDNTEIITIRLFGICVYKRTLIDHNESRNRPCGFQVFDTYAPEYIEDEYEDEYD